MCATKSGNWLDKIGLCLGNLHAEATQIIISRYPEFYSGRTVAYGKMCASSGLHVMLSQHLLSFFLMHVNEM